MNELLLIFYKILYQPILNALILLYKVLPGHDFGLAVIFLTVLIKLILLPVSLKTIKSQKKMKLLQSKIKAVQKKYKNDKSKQSQEMMALYQKEGVNPFSGCLPFVLQIGILIGLYQVFLRGFSKDILQQWLYGFVSMPETLNLSLLGVVDLTKPNFVLALTASVLQFIQSKKAFQQNSFTQKEGASSLIQKQMLYFMPLLTFFIAWKFGALIALYWIVNTLFSIGEYYIVKQK